MGVVNLDALFAGGTSKGLSGVRKQRKKLADGGVHPVPGAELAKLFPRAYWGVVGRSPPPGAELRDSMGAKPTANHDGNLVRQRETHFLAQRIFRKLQGTLGRGPPRLPWQSGNTKENKHKQKT